MSENEQLGFCLRSLNYGVAVADPETWSVGFENAKFFEWFPPPPEAVDSLPDRLLGLNLERAKDRLKRGRAYRFETEIKAAGRTVSLSVELRIETFGEREVLMVECQNISKQKQAEYMLDSYSQMAERNARELQREKDRVERLLLNVMPRTVYEEMKDLGTVTPQRFAATSVLMLDFVGFTKMVVAREPGALIGELNDIFSSFDRMVEMYGCERIKTLGDGYMAVSGIPDENPDHAANIAKVALRMRRYLERRNASHPSEWRCRIGIHTGPLIGSLVGVQKYVYDVFGPAVNFAARLEQLSEPMQITLSCETCDMLADEFEVSERGEFEVKGFGPCTLYSLDDEIRGRR